MSQVCVWWPGCRSQCSKPPIWATNLKLKQKFSFYLFSRKSLLNLSKHLIILKYDLFQTNVTVKICVRLISNEMLIYKCKCKLCNCSRYCIFCTCITLHLLSLNLCITSRLVCYCSRHCQDKDEDVHSLECQALGQVGKGCVSKFVGWNSWKLKAETIAVACQGTWARSNNCSLSSISINIINIVT